MDFIELGPRLELAPLLRRRDPVPEELADTPGVSPKRLPLSVDASFLIAASGPLDIFES